MCAFRGLLINRWNTFGSRLPIKMANDGVMEELLDDMIYSGDIEGFIRKKNSLVVTEDFEAFLKQRCIYQPL